MLRCFEPSSRPVSGRLRRGGRNAATTRANTSIARFVRRLASGVRTHVARCSRTMAVPASDLIRNQPSQRTMYYESARGTLQGEHVERAAWADLVGRIDRERTARG